MSCPGRWYPPCCLKCTVKYLIWDASSPKLADDNQGAMKQFYRFIKSLRNDATGVSPLKVVGRVYATAKEKADACNRQFQSAFSTSNDPSVSTPFSRKFPGLTLQNTTQWHSHASCVNHWSISLHPNSTHILTVTNSYVTTSMGSVNIDHVKPSYTAHHRFCNAYEKGNRVDSIVSDFSKAFDKVRHGRQSKKCEVACGVPQGSILGSLFFIIYINDIVHGLNSNIRLFADDALLYQTIHSENDRQLMQQDLDALLAWADRWSMEFNANKCYSLHMMTKHQKRKAVCIPYKMGGHLLERVTDTKYLGVSINEHIQ